MCTLPKRQAQINSLSMKEYDIAIIGGGPAGIMAAIAASRTSRVILLEKNPSLGRKLLMTGGGRCNITNDKPIKQLLTFFNNKNFLKHSFYSFTNEDLFSLFDFDFITEDDDRVFPETERAGDVLKGLIDKLEDVVISYNFEVKKITDDFVINNCIKADRIIIATGGVTYPQTGCSPDNYSLTSHPITDIKYGLSPLVTREDLSDIAGVTLNDVVISYKKTRVRGNVLVSHVGLTGPGIINLSNEISEDISYNLLAGEPDVDLEISVDLCPDISREELLDRFTDDFQAKGKTYLKNYLKRFLTNSFIEYYLKRCGIGGDVQLSRVNKKSKNKLIENLKRFTFEINGFNGDLAKVTIGGVDLGNVNSKTMESTLIPGLYFAGEVLNLHGPTGGYNLKIAFSTGYLAGLSAALK
ncbi:NAD(P)/FAD-dependent oxidoreductase [Methanobrevibacter sp.]|uniref:NAD(P)/FAD-dependent oxidoreductase n=2 Tax=Methanobrevibacter sp. TaxID=66852 RepID=UPI003869266F